jgi:hypothetical protein
MSPTNLCTLASSLLLAIAAQAFGGDTPNGRLIAHWTFNDSSVTTCGDATGHGWQAAAVRGKIPGQRGIFGRAINLTDDHLLQVSERIPLGDPAGIAISVWVKPAELSRYREIFRKEDGKERVLFSFQNNGTVLSLGLNINGYVECDAKIDPARVRDGRWHHCAATFDGQWMRVYFDGNQIGSLRRPGTIRAGTAAPACIGSNNGGESFQGGMDDLRIYAGALSASEVAAIHRQGWELFERSNAQLAQQIQAIYGRGPSFAETLMDCRRQLVEKRLTVDRDLAVGVTMRLKTDFADDYEQFTTLSGTQVVDFLQAPDADGHVKFVEQSLALLNEYRPLTEHQRRKQTAADQRKWEEAEAFSARIERLKAEGEAALYSPQWIALLLEIGPKIQFRPYLQEAVAPYVKPETPVTCNLTADEARETLRRDWLFQAGSKPSALRIRQEIDWTRRLAARIAGSGKVQFGRELARLDAIEKQLPSLSEADAELYFQVREVKRTIALANPVVDFDRVLFVDMPYPAGKEWKHETRHRLGYMAVPGARLLILSGLSPSGSLKQLMPQTPLHGSFWRPDLSWDAQKVLFCFKPHNEKSFHLYEINIDGSGLVQLTDGRFDDLDPIYLPDGKHILFSTTRGHSYVRCMPPTNAFVLARCDSDGRNIYLVSANNEPDYLPSVMNDGRVIYTRWEYTDKPVWRAQKLWTINPDGTQVNTYWGNQSVWPDVVKDARAIPGSRRVMFTGSAHHNWFAGSVGIIDPDHGYNFPDGLTKITADVIWPESGNGPVDPIESPDYHSCGNYWAYYSPYPLGERDFLVSAQRDDKFLLYLMDVDGNRELIYEGVNNIFHAIPVRTRVRPPEIADRVAWPTRDDRQHPKKGVIFSANVYQGAPPVLQGKARYLRVMNIDPKTYTYWHKRPYVSTGPVVSAVQSEGVKRVLGTVEIERDGSVAMEVPPGMALHFQLLDENYRALQTMRSFVGVMPGERRGCLGCHESHSRTPQTRAEGVALIKSPQTITPPPWGEDTVSYPRYVQPVLDKYCNRCHGGDGEARKTLDLTFRPGMPQKAEPYLTLIGRPTWGKPYETPKNPPPGFGIAGMIMVEGYGKTDPAGYVTPPPMTYLSYRSRLIELCSNGKHYDVKVDPLSLQRLIAWVDAMCPYSGDDEIREEDDPVFQGVEWLAIRPRLKNAPRIIRPGPVD